MRDRGEEVVLDPVATTRHSFSGGEEEGVAERRSVRGSVAAPGAPAAARVVHDNGHAISVPPPAAP